MKEQKIDLDKITINPEINRLLLKILNHKYDGYFYARNRRVLIINETTVKFLLSLRLSEIVDTHLKKFLKNLTSPPEEYKDLNDEKLREELIKTAAQKDLENLLTTEDTIKISRAVLRDKSILAYKNDNWNNYGDFISSWRDELLDALKENGFSYNEDNDEFTFDQEPIIISHRIYLTDNFIKLEAEEELYKKLIKEINLAYKNELFTAVFILSRKLIENLLIDILRKKYPINSEGLSIYYNARKGAFKNFSDLLEEFKNRKNDFKPDLRAVEEILANLELFRPMANSQAHSITFYGKKDDLNKFDMQRIIELSMYIKNRC
jgi:predicted house-cleaning noncanonical NTP pyrophosphatase (MazG superfamily)